MVMLDGLRYGLQDHGFAGLGRRYDETALALADGRHQVDDPGGQVLGAAVTHLQLQTLLREQRRQVLEDDLVARLFRRFKVDLVDFEQREVALAFLGGPDLAGDIVAGTQVKASYLAGRDVDIIGTGQVGTVCGTQKSESVLENLQYAAAVDVFALSGMGLEDFEDDVLFSRTGQTVETEGFRYENQLRCGLLL